MYNNKYISGNNYVFENGKTFKYNGRRFDGTGKYIGDSFTSKPTYRDNVVQEIHTNPDSNNDPNINTQNIRETSKLYQGRRSYNNKKSIESERIRLNNIVRKKQIVEKNKIREKRKIFTKKEKQEHERIRKSKILSNRHEIFSIASRSSSIKKKNVPIQNRLFAS